MAETRVHFRTCNLCEAMCGLRIEVEGEQIRSIRGDPDDPFSKGFVCPKATALEDVHVDPDRQKLPLRRTGDGWTRLGWYEAFHEVDIILSPVSPTPAFKVGAHSDDPVAMYLEDVFLDGQVMAGIPALSVPCGFSKATDRALALPIGLQIMGAQWQEEMILRAAYAYEQATEWHNVKPPL